MDVGYFIQFIILLQFSVSIQVEGCIFPTQWRGSWYQREGELEITKTRITTKGECYNKEGDKYIVKTANSDGNVCYTCLAITKRHDNILQYKQSHCVEGSSTACSSIRGDALLHTLVRESTSHIVPCPFEGPLSFIYDNGTGFCAHPRSTISECANPAHLKVHFKECPGFTDALNLQLTCLATWTNGPQYVFGKFTGHGYTTKKLQYRCMTYDSSRNELALSADATCLGLEKFDWAPIQLELRKESSTPYTSPTCKLPSWLTSTTWRDLTGHTVYEPVGEGVIHVRQGPGRHGHIHETTHRCRESKHEDPSLYQFISYTTHGCSSSFQCIRVSKLAPDGSVLRIQTGKYVSESKKGEACSDENMANTTTYTIIANASNIIQCPFRGYYSLESSTNCDDVINTRCDDTGQIVIDSCNVQEGNLQCIASWTKDEKTHIIATTPSTHRTNCFRFSSEGGRYRLDLDTTCNNGVSPILKSAYPSYMLKKVSGTCLMKEKDATSSSSSSSSSSSTNPQHNINTNSNDTSSASRYHTQYSLVSVLILIVLWVIL